MRPLIMKRVQVNREFRRYYELSCMIIYSVFQFAEIELACSTLMCITMVTINIVIMKLPESRTYFKLITIWYITQINQPKASSV